VERKLKTTYNEVADELVFEVLHGDPQDSGEDEPTAARQYDEKNIRRRVYDALNVLLAMDIIEKSKKEIIWRGFPGQSREISQLHSMRSKVRISSSCRPVGCEENVSKRLYRGHSH